MDLNKLLSYSVDSGASDLHLSVGSIPMVRINGTMQPLNMSPLKQEDVESILPQILDEDQLSYFEKNCAGKKTTLELPIFWTMGKKR